MATANIFFVMKIMMGMVAMLTITVSADPDLLQDICVADHTSGVKVNGYPCKTNVTADDFFFCGLSNPASTNNTFQMGLTLASVQNFPGLNTLGLAISRLDYAPGGINPPHLHPRASEIGFVLEGEMEVGFISTDNVLYTKILKKGEVFVFPRGLIHFQKNVGNVPATMITAFNSQFPGTQKIAPSLFSASPPLPVDVLTKAFLLDTNKVDEIKSMYAPKK